MNKREQSRSNIKESNVNKAEKIKNTIRETRQRRKEQRPITYQLKLQNLTKVKKEKLQRAFLEAKWFYNWLVSDLVRLNISANKVSTVEVKVGNTFEERQLTVLGSQVRQEIANRLRDNLRALKKLRENGSKVGKLKPKNFVNSIPLVQYRVTYRLDFKRNRVRIQKLGKFRVLGLHQIPANAEITSAVLVRKPSGYYLHVTCYLPKNAPASQTRINKDIGVDLGIKTKLTLSNGMKIDFDVHETPRLKRIQRRIARSKKGSRSRERLRFLLRKEYEKIINRRRDAQNKILAFLKLYRKVVFQDDCIKGWYSCFGKAVHSSGIGGLKSRLRTSLETSVPVKRGELTTNECFVCGERLNISLSDRKIECKCGWSCDRDVNAALVILRKGLGLSPNQTLGLDRSKVTPVERDASARILGSNPYICVSNLVETGSPLLR